MPKKFPAQFVNSRTTWALSPMGQLLEDLTVYLHFGNLTLILRQRFIAANKLWHVPDFLAKFGARKALDECSRKQQQQKSYSHIQLGFATLHATKKLFASLSLSHVKRSEANSKENTCCALQFKSAGRFTEKV